MDFLKGKGKGKSSPKGTVRVKAGVTPYMPDGRLWSCPICTEDIPLINKKVRDIIFLGAAPSEDRVFREACAHAVCRKCWNQQFSKAMGSTHNPYDFYGTPNQIMHHKKKGEQVAVLEILDNDKVMCLYHQNPVKFILYFDEFSTIDGLERIALQIFAEKGYEIASYRVAHGKIQEEFGHIRETVIKKKFIEVFCKRAKAEELDEHLAALNL